MSKPINNKAGIGCDNYKVEKFKSELTKAGFEILGVFALTDDTSFIQVKATPEQHKELAKLCTKVEFHFKRGN